MLWASIISLCFLAMCLCDDATVSNTKFSTISGHVQSTTPSIKPDHVYTNQSKEVIGARSIDYRFGGNQTFYQRKRTFKPSGNELWDGIIDDCLYKPSFSCFQKNVYSYLDNTLRLADVNVTERIQFKKIDIDPDLLAQLQNTTEDEHDNEVLEETREFKSGFLFWKTNSF